MNNPLVFPGFTAEASLPDVNESGRYRGVMHEAEFPGRVVPARSFMGDIICGGLLDLCIDQNGSSACRAYGSLCTLGGIFG
jgi:hypothetical protein